MYEKQNMSANDIAKEFDCSSTAVKNSLKRNNIAIRSISEGGLLARQRKVDPKTKRLKVNRTGEKAGEMQIISHSGWESLCNGRNQPTWNVICSCGNSLVMTSAAWKSVLGKHQKVLKGEGSDTWRLHCNDHPHHSTDARVGDKLSYLEVIGLPRNEGQLGWTVEDGRTASDKEGKFLIALKCNGCDKYDESNPLFTTIPTWRGRQKNVEEGGTASCGCMSSVSHGMSTKGKGDPGNYKIYTMVKSARSRAKKEGIPFDIDEHYVKELGIPEYCPVLGIKIDLENEDERKDASPSLDKFYPENGYVKGNVQIISWRANRIKNDGSPEEWLRIAEWCQQEDVRRKLSGDISEE